MYVRSLKYGLISISKLSEDGCEEALFTQKNVVISGRNGEVKLIGEHYNGLYFLTKVVMNSSAKEFHNSANVLKDDRSNREVDGDGNMISRGCVKYAKHDSISAKDKKNIFKVRGKLLTSNFDDDRQSSLSKIDDRLSVTTRRKFDEVDDIDVLHQDTMRYSSGRNVNLVSKDDTDKYFNKK
jgi:hypothetical protein